MSQIFVGVEHFSCPKLFVQNIDENLSSFLATFEENDDSNYTQAVKFLFGHDSVLRELHINEIEDKLFKPTLSTLQKVVCSSLMNNLSTLENSEDADEEVYFSLSKKLQACLDILGGYFDILEYILSIQCLKLYQIESLIQTFPSILLEIFSHCQGSENNYGSYFAMLSEILTAIFRKSYDVLSLFHKVLDDHITIDLSLEKDVNLLITVLEILFSIGEIIVTLDVKTVVEQWKSLAKLLTIYSSSLKDRLNIAQPIKFLCSNLRNTIKTITDEQNQDNDKIRNRYLKVGCFVLKVVVKLCELYCGYLDSCICDLLNLILVLNRCSRLSQKAYNEELDRFIVVGAGPLLSHLIRDRQFIGVFKNFSENIDTTSKDDLIGLLFTYLRLFKLLINCNELEVKDDWLKLPLLPSVINLFKKCCSTLDFTITLDGNDTYTVLVSVIVAFMISNLSVDQFISVERVLFRELFQSDFQTGIFISDLLTLLCRLTNEDVCLRQTRYIFQVLNTVVPLRPEVCLIRTTALRLMSLLSKSGQESIRKDFRLLSHTLRNVHLSSTEKLCVGDRQTLENSEPSTPLQYMNMFEGLYLQISLSSKTKILDENTTNRFRRILIGLRSCTSVSEKQADWWYNMFYIVSKCITKLSAVVDNNCFSDILENYFELAALGQPSTYYFATNLVADIFKKTPSLINSQFSKAVSVFERTFSSGNTVVKNIAIDKFVSTEDFAAFCDLSEFDNDVQKNIAEYSKRQLLSCPNDFFIDFKIDFTHKCFVNEIQIDLCDEAPNKKFKPDNTDTNVCDAIKNLQECAERIITYANHNNLSLVEKNIIQSSIHKLVNL